MTTQLTLKCLQDSKCISITRAMLLAHSVIVLTIHPTFFFARLQLHLYYSIHPIDISNCLVLLGYSINDTLLPFQIRNASRLLDTSHFQKRAPRQSHHIHEQVRLKVREWVLSFFCFVTTILWYVPMLFSKCIAFAHKSAAYISS